MKIVFITQEIHDRLKEIYENHPSLTLQSTDYRYIAEYKLSQEEKECLKEIEGILRNHIAGFDSFSNFRLNTQNQLQLRIQYNYNYDNQNPPFTGVGYILLDHLLNGFPDDAPDSCKR